MREQFGGRPTHSDDLISFVSFGPVFAILPVSPPLFQLASVAFLMQVWSVDGMSIDGCVVLIILLGIEPWSSTALDVDGVRLLLLLPTTAQPQQSFFLPCFPFVFTSARSLAG